MNCPACSKTLTQKIASGVTLDVCTSGCGGIWFDSGEFEKFDEERETAGVEILRPVRNANTAIDRNRARACPKCTSGNLKKKFYDTQYELQIDQCPLCSGIFLDLGELETIREQNQSAEERKRVIADFYDRAKSENEHANKGLKALLGLVFK